MDKLDLRIQKIATQYLSIPEDFNRRTEQTLNIIKCKNKSINIKEKLIKTIVSILITIFGITGICFATSEIYDYIQQKRILSGGLGEIDNEESSLLQSDMIFDSENEIYYKIVENVDDYLKYKNKIDELPEMNVEDFEDNAIFIMTYVFSKEPDEKNLKIADITTDNETTYIQLENDETSTQSNFTNILYAIFSKDKLKENIKIEILHLDINLEGFVDIKELPINYSVNEAIKDGCIVVEQGILKSDNSEILDKLTNLSSENEENYCRIYNKIDNEIQIVDIMYFNGLYHMNSCNLNDSERKIEYSSFEYLDKDILKGNESEMILYSGMYKLYDDYIEEGIPIVLYSQN